MEIEPESEQCEQPNGMGKALPVHLFDLGHQGDIDYTQIDLLLRMTPTERLRHHEGWRLFVKEALEHARIRREDHHAADSGAG
jgi:hypothetical protein